MNERGQNMDRTTNLLISSNVHYVHT